MKFKLRYLFLIIVFNTTNCFSQSDNNIRFFEKFAYPIYCVTKSDSAAKGTGFFVKSSKINYLVSAAHIFYDSTTSKLRDFRTLTIYIPDYNRYFDYPFPTNEIYRCCYNKNACFDLALIPLNIPDSLINLTILPNTKTFSDTLPGEKVIIVGFPGDTLKTVSTSLLNWNGNNANFITKISSGHGGSGGPVFIISKDGSVSLGGSLIGQDRLTGNGIICKAGVLTSFLDKGLPAY